MTNLVKAGVLALAISSSFVSSVAVAKNSFLVAPTRAHFDIAKTEAQTFIITNTGDEAIRLELMPDYIPVGKDGFNIGTHMEEGVAELENISELVRVSPRKLSLEPGQRRDVKVQLRAKPGAEDGDYRAHLFVKMVENAYTANVGSSDNAEGMNMKLNIKMETAVAIYGRKGDLVEDIKVSCLTDGNGYQATIQNHSNYKFEGKIKIGDAEPVNYIGLRKLEKTFNMGPGIKGSDVLIMNKQGSQVAKATCI